MPAVSQKPNVPLSHVILDGQPLPTHRGTAAETADPRAAVAAAAGSTHLNGEDGGVPSVNPGAVVGAGGACQAAPDAGAAGVLPGPEDVLIAKRVRNM